MQRIRISILSILLFAEFIAAAQPSIQIADAENRTNLPQAFVIFRSLINAQKQSQIADTAGKVFIPTFFSLPIEIRISYLGFVNYIDTIQSRESIVIYLPKDVRYLKEAVITDPLSVKQNGQGLQKIQVIDALAIEKMAAVNLKDVLTNQLNFRISQDNATGSSNLSLQGIGGQNVKILIDGVPVIGRVFDQVDLAQLNLNNIERIEIVEGPLSVSYGTNALAGAINIITKKQTGKKLNIVATTYNESNRTSNNSFNLNNSGPKVSTQLNMGRNFFGGWSQQELDRTWDWNLKEQYYLRGQLFYKFKNGDLNYRLEGIHEKIKDRGIPNIYGEMAIDEYFFSNRLDNVIQMNGKIGGKRPLNTIVSYNVYNRIQEKRVKDLVTLSETTSENPDDRDTNLFKAVTIRSVLQGKKNSWAWMYGVDINYEWGSGGRIKKEGAQMGDFAAFSSADWSVSKQLQIRGGLRMAYHTIYQAPLIPSVQLIYSTNLKWNYRASWARGFRSPTLKELYLNFVDANHQVNGNENLKPESSDNFQVGIDHKWNKTNRLLKTELSFFYNDISNKIGLLILSATQGSYTNFGRFNSVGGNFKVTYNFKKWSNQIGISHVGIKNSGFEIRSNSFAWTPELQFNTNYSFEKPKIVLAFYAKYNGAVKQIGTNPETNAQTTFRTNAYTWMDFNAMKQFKKGLSLGLGAKNLLNVTNVNSTLVFGVHNQGSSGISIGTGRTFYMKLEYKWLRK